MTKINYFEIEKADYEFLKTYFIDKFDNRSKSALRHIFNEYMPDQPKNKVNTEVVYVQNERRSKNIYADPVIQIALKYLERYHYYTTDLNYKKYYIELFQYSCVGSANQLDYLTYHEDDYAVMQYKVNTVIFYLSKSDALIGGDLIVDICNKRTTVPVKAGMCLTFEGDLTHKPEPCNGYGLRECIVVHLARDDTPISRDTPISLEKRDYPEEIELSDMHVE